MSPVRPICASWYVLVQLPVCRVDPSVLTILFLPQQFYGARLYNAPMLWWNVNKVVTFDSMFREATSFNQDLAAWQLESATDLRSMFKQAYAFDAVVSSWNTSTVTTMRSLFEDCTSFTGDVSSWDTRNVEDFSGLFAGAYRCVGIPANEEQSMIPMSFLTCVRVFGFPQFQR